MAVEVIFPRVDMDMTTGRINRWLAEDGSVVRKGEPLFEIETDKAAMEIEAPAEGTLRTVRVADGAEIPVGSPIAWIVPVGESWTAAVASEAAPAATPELAGPVAMVVVAPRHEPAVAEIIRATPLARREAARLGLDLARVPGSGPRGRIVSADLQALLERPPAVPTVAAPAARAVAAPALTAVASTLHANWVGRGQGTPVVFLHGFAADGSGWRPVTSLLDSSARMLVLDLPGHGRSAPTAEKTFAGLVEAARVALAEAGVSRAHLVGHSLGGAVAIALAEQVDDIRSLTLLAPAGFGPEIDADVLSGLIRAERAESLAPWLRRLFADPTRVTPAYVQAVLRARAAPGLREFQTALANSIFPDGTQSVDIRDVLARLSIPIKIAWGLRDAIIPARHARALPGAVAVHAVPDIGHMPHTEAPGLIATLITQSRRAGE